MKKSFIILFILPLFVRAQNSFIAIIKGEGAQESLAGATVNIKSLKMASTANNLGVVVLKNIPNGNYDFEISCVGYNEVEKTFKFPLTSTDTIQIFLELAPEEL